MKIRHPDEWTDVEWCAIIDIATKTNIVGVARKIFDIATREVEERPEIEPGTPCFFSDTLEAWESAGLYFERGKNPSCHYRYLIYESGVPYVYARPVPKGYKPGDKIDPPTEADR